MLKVHTARITYGGPDRLDVTANSKDRAGRPFAPSWPLVQWGLRMRNKTEQMRLRGDPEAQPLWAMTWKLYAMRYRERMRVSYATQRRAWDELLSREHVVLVCYCTDPEHCHRRVLATILDKLGAHDAGELPASEQARRSAAPALSKGADE